jgi:hypothetical protein
MGVADLTAWYNGNESSTLLSVEPSLSQLPFKLSGTTDVAICSMASVLGL